MKRYLIRCMGTILSAFATFLTTDRAEAGTLAFNYSGTFTLDNVKYTVSVYTGSAWYVGWINLNQGAGSSSNATYKEIWVNTAYVSNKDGLQPTIADRRGSYSGVLVSSRDFNISATLSAPRFPLEGAGTGSQEILYDNSAGWVTSMKPLAYSPNSGIFKDAGCCYYTPTSRGGGSYGFSYSGNGQTHSACPCFYTLADKVYSGNSCTNYMSSKCTGTSYTGGAEVGTSSKWPAKIVNVAFCYKFSSCTNTSKMYMKSSYTSTSDYSGCHMVRVPIVGKAEANVNDLFYNTVLGDYTEAFNPELTELMICETGYTARHSESCSSFVGNFLNANGEGGCGVCPTVSGTTVGGYTISNTSGYVDDTTYGVKACKFSSPVSSDSYGTFELTSSAGTSQTCYGAS